MSATRARRDRAWRVTEPEPPRGIALPFAPGVRRIVAPNPSPMTCHGTNTWLVDWEGGTALIDPGSDDPRHLDALAAEAGGRLSHILLTHTHADHIGGAAALGRRLGVPLAGFGDAGFTPDLRLVDGSTVAGLVAMHTPGHAMDHLCFRRPDGILFSGDHVMGWSTSVVPPPPHGDLGLFLQQLERVRDSGCRVILSAHGAPILRPEQTVQGLIEHRMAREASIGALLGDASRDTEAVLASAYLNVKPQLLRPARLNLLSHLLKLEQDGRAGRDAEGWFDVAARRRECRPPAEHDTGLQEAAGGVRDRAHT